MDRRRCSYGRHPSQVAELLLPTGVVQPPVVVLLHGGFWRERWDRSLMEPLAVDLVARGFAAWNLEYRRVGAGGGWPATFDDVVAGIRALPRPPAAIVGHSAGAQLAFWAASRVPVGRIVGQAGVLDLVEAARLGLSNGAASELVGDRDALLSALSPLALLPLGKPALLVHGTADDTVPVAFSERYAMAARTMGDTVELALLSGCGHLEHLDPASEAWRAVVGFLDAPHRPPIRCSWPHLPA
jgi:acetyl esterase/lipase